MSKSTFAQRFGINQPKPIHDDFPQSSQIALAYLLQDLVRRGYIVDCQENSTWSQELSTELFRIARKDFYVDEDTSFYDLTISLLDDLEWYKVFLFCERVYERFLSPVETQVYMEDGGYYSREKASLADVRNFYDDEINNLLNEENLAYQFIDGNFHRRGRAQTQKNIERVGVVLANPTLSGVRNHFNKAKKFFDERPESDVKNCIKEALCALEASLEILTGKSAKDFSKLVKQFAGNGERQIPPPIAQGIEKLYGYRGSGQGVAHAALSGNKVTEIEAELVLSLVATYITYLVDLFPQSEDEIPF